MAWNSSLFSSTPFGADAYSAWKPGAVSGADDYSGVVNPVSASVMPPVIAAPAAAAASPAAAAAGTGLGWGQMGGTAGSSGLLGLGQLGISGIGTLGSLWTAMSGLELAKKQFNFQKEFAQTNLANQTKNYNTTLSDKANARYFTENKPQSEADSYIAANRL